MSILLLMQKIRERPGLYLRKKSLDLLEHFMFGYKLRDDVASWVKETGKDASEYFNAIITSMPLDQIDISTLFLNFQIFVHSYYGRELGALSEYTLISRNSYSDEEAFDKYFELFDMFLNEQKIKSKIE